MIHRTCKKGRRSSQHKGNQAVPVVDEQSLSVQEELPQQELITMNEKIESTTLEQVETKPTETSIPVEAEARQEAEEKISQESADAIQDAPKTSKGGLGKVVVGGTILAFLLGGGYYYAQHKNVFGLGGASNSDGALSSEEEWIDTEVMSTPAGDDSVMTEKKLSVEDVVSDSVSAPETIVKDAMPLAAETHIENTPLTDTQEEAVVAMPSDSTVNATLADKQTLEISDHAHKMHAAHVTTVATPIVQELPSIRSVFNVLLGLYQIADFERAVRANKDNTLKALTAIKGHLALQAEALLWESIRQAVDKDIQALIAAEEVSLEALFKATAELAELVKTAPFVSAERTPDNVAISVQSSNTAPSMETMEGSWFDKVMHYVKHLPRQLFEAIRSDLGGLVRVEKLSNPAVATLSVSDIQSQRAETLRQLSIAQEALLKREEAAWKAAIKMVEQQFMVYYNMNDEKTQQAIALVRRLMGMPVKSNLPALSNTQQALEQLARQLPVEN